MTVTGQFAPGAARVASLATVVAVALVSGRAALANPEGGQVVGGSATIEETSSTRLDVIQSTDSAIINWQSFSIGAGEHTNFQQPSSSSVTLNRVVGANLSEIYGRLTANGQIYLINPVGVVFGEGANVDVNGLVASTANIADRDFMAGRYEFSVPGDTSGFIVNRGSVTAAEGGLVAFVAPWVENQGVIAASLGRVVLAGAETFTLDLYGDSLVRIAVDDTVTEALYDMDGNPVDALVANSGDITADGGQVLLTARSAGGVVDNAINMDGMVVANSVAEVNGEVVFFGAGAGDDAGETGGTVTVLGERVGLFGDARIDVSGDAGGGTALIGGGFQGSGEHTARQTLVAATASISADAGAAGDAGTVVVWADGLTRFAGSISARGGAQAGDGGLVEVSGKETLDYRGAVDTRAPAGDVGTLLLDPTNIEVAGASEAGVTIAEVDNAGDADVDNGGGGADATTNTIAAADIVTALNTTNVTLQATNNIVVTNAINASGNAGSFGLTLDADNQIQINNSITTNDGFVTLTGTGNTIIFNTGNNPAIDTTGGDFDNGGDVTLTGAVTLSQATTIQAGTGAITINGAVTGANALTLDSTDSGFTAGGNMVLNGDVTISAFDAQGVNNFTNNGTLTTTGNANVAVIFGDVDVGNASFNFANSFISFDEDNPGDLSGTFNGGNLDIFDVDILDIIANLTGDLDIDAANGGTVDGSVGGTTTIPDGVGGALGPGGGGANGDGFDLDDFLGFEFIEELTNRDVFDSGDTLVSEVVEGEDDGGGEGDEQPGDDDEVAEDEDDEEDAVDDARRRKLALARRLLEEGKNKVPDDLGLKRLANQLDGRDRIQELLNAQKAFLDALKDKNEERVQELKDEALDAVKGRLQDFALGALQNIDKINDIAKALPDGEQKDRLLKALENGTVQDALQGIKLGAEAVGEAQDAAAEIKGQIDQLNNLLGGDVQAILLDVAGNIPGLDKAVAAFQTAKDVGEAIVKVGTIIFEQEVIDDQQAALDNNLAIEQKARAAQDQQVKDINDAIRNADFALVQAGGLNTAEAQALRDDANALLQGLAAAGVPGLSNQAQTVLNHHERLSLGLPGLL